MLQWQVMKSDVAAPQVVYSQFWHINTSSGGGAIAGAVWQDERVVHIVSDKKEDIEKCVTQNICKKF